MISLTCPTCQKVLKSSVVIPAGKKVKCPGCQSLFVVPDTGIQSAAPAPRPVIPQPVIPQPLPVLPKSAPLGSKGKDPYEAKTVQLKPLRSLDDDEDDAERPRSRRSRANDDDDDDRPRRKAKKSGSRGLLFGMLGAGGVAFVLLFCTLGFVWPGFFRGGGGGGGGDVALLQFIPAQSNSVLAVNIGNALQAGTRRQQFEKAINENAQLNADQKALFREFNQIVVAGNIESKLAAVVFQTRKPYDVQAARRAFAGGELEQKNGKSFFWDGKKEMVLAFASPNIILACSKEAELMQMLESKSAPPAILAASGAWGGNSLWFHADISQLQQQMKGAPGMPGPLGAATDALKSAKAVSGFIDLGSSGGSFRMKLAMVCTNADAAKQLELMGNAAWGMGKMMISGQGQALAAQGPEGQTMKMAADDLVNTLSISQAGDTVQASMSLRDETVARLESLDLSKMIPMNAIPGMPGGNIQGGNMPGGNMPGGNFPGQGPGVPKKFGGSKK